MDVHFSSFILFITFKSDWKSSYKIFFFEKSRQRCFATWPSLKPMTRDMIGQYKDKSFRVSIVKIWRCTHRQFLKRKEIGFRNQMALLTPRWSRNFLSSGERCNSRLYPRQVLFAERCLVSSGYSVIFSLLLEFVVFLRTKTDCWGDSNCLLIKSFCERLVNNSHLEKRKRWDSFD